MGGLLSIERQPSSLSLLLSSYHINIIIITIVITRLPTNPRQATRECLCLVKRGHFRSRDKDGDYTIRSTVSKNPMVHANITALSSAELELLPIEVLHCENREFREFCYCNLDLDPMTFIYKLNAYPLMLHPQTKNELSTSNACFPPSRNVT